MSLLELATEHVITAIHRPEPLLAVGVGALYLDLRAFVLRLGNTPTGY